MNKQALDHSLRYIDSWLRFRYGRETVPGYVVAVAHKGKIIFNKAYGYADLEKQTPLTPEHIFRIASHSKTFTATALMQLAEQGKLRLDDYVVDYLPWLKQHQDTRWQKVTLRQLLSHGASVIRDGEHSDYWNVECPFPDEKTFKNELLAARLVLDNNIKLKYSNYGFTLLGMVVEAISGQPYNTYVSQHIVKALGLKHTGPEFTPAIASQLVTGYTREDVDHTRLPIMQIDTRAMSSATGFYSTAEDLCTYFSAHIVGSKKLLSDESKKEMQRVQWHGNVPGDRHEDYGLGMEIEYVGERTTFGHGGGFPGHITKSICDPKDELVAVALTNCASGPATHMAKGVFSILDYFQKNTPTRKPKHDLSKLEGRYLDLWTMADIVVTGDKVVDVYPDTWFPFEYPEELEYIDDTTLKIKETNSFFSEGELVKFNLKNGTVESMVYAGSTMLPEKAWIRKQKSRKTVQLP